MNLRQIDVFRQVMLRGSMTAAAEELRTSQPSVSRTIAELEAKTGLKLFTRYAGRIVPTDAGMAFFREVEQSYRGLDSLAQSAQEIRLQGNGRLRISAVPAMAIGLLPYLIRRFRDDYPNVAISLEMRSESTIRRWASAAYCDLGFTSLRPEAYGVHLEALYSLPGVCALPRDHPLARRKQLAPTDLTDVDLIIPSHADITRRQIDTMLESANLPKVPTIETPYAHTICALVAEGLGVGIVNPLVAWHRPPADVVFIPFTPAVTYRGYVAVPDAQRGNPLVIRFATLAHEAIAQRFASHRFDESSMSSAAVSGVIPD